MRCLINQLSVSGCEELGLYIPLLRSTGLNKQMTDFVSTYQEVSLPCACMSRVRFPKMYGTAQAWKKGSDVESVHPFHRVKAALLIFTVTRDLARCSTSGLFCRSAYSERGHALPRVILQRRSNKCTPKRAILWTLVRTCLQLLTSQHKLNTGGTVDSRCRTEGVDGLCSAQAMPLCSLPKVCGCHTKEALDL